MKAVIRNIEKVCGLFLFFVVQINCSAQIQIGDSLSNLKVIKKIKELTSPNQLDDCYLVEKMNVRFNVCAENNLIFYVSTSDPRFSFQGLHVGTQVKEIKNVTKQYNIKGWSYVVENDSEWKFMIGLKTINAESKIISFFKYDSKRRISSKDKNDIEFKF
ncbi:MAG: hypothetical protein ACRCVT_02470 [Leadbetterella sp.]